jgi:hypothetical protein
MMGFAMTALQKRGPEPATNPAHIARMTKPHEVPVIEPFPDNEGTDWHVIIRYREGHERGIEGFASKAEAVDWIEANATQVKERE